MQSLSLPSALVQTFPGADIQWVTRRDMAPLLKHHPHIHKVWEFDRKTGVMGLIQLCMQMRMEGFTHIYDAHNNTRSRVISFLLRPFGFLGIGPAFIRRSIRRWKRFLLFRLRVNTFEMPFSGQRDLIEPLQPWGVSKIPPAAPQIFLDASDVEKARLVLGDFVGSIALAPSAAYMLKRWPKEYWQQLILARSSERFVLLGGPEDTFIEDIRSVAPERVLNLAGKCSLTVSSGVIALSRMLIANDTGLLHVAEQLGKNAIALMGPAPFGFPCRPSTAVMEINLACRPCSKHGQGPCVNKVKFHQCLVDIRPADVSQKMSTLQGKAL